MSENHVRMDVFAEADKLTKMFHGALSVNETYDSDRSRWLSQTVKRYKEEGFQGERFAGYRVVHSKDERDWVRVERQVGTRNRAFAVWKRPDFVSVRQVDHGTEGVQR